MSLTKVSYSMIQGAVANILDYGASTEASGKDNSDAIAAAFAASNSVYIPPGTFTINTIYVDAQQRLFGAGMYVSTLRKLNTDNTAAIVVRNTDVSGANVPYATTLDNFQVMGDTTLNPALVSQVGIYVTSDSAKTGLNVVKFDMHDVAVNYMSAEGIVLNGATGSNIINCDIKFNCASGIRMHADAVGLCFNNAIRIDKCRIKHNAIGIYCQGYAVQGITGVPSGAVVNENVGNTVSNCLIESNLTSPSTGDIYTYESGIGGPARPGIGILLEGGREWVISDNWFEAHFNHLKINGGCKLNVIENNKFSLLSAGSEVAPAPDSAGNIVFTGASGPFENVRSIITKNYFATQNARVGGTYEGDHVVLIGGFNQANRFLHNRQEWGANNNNLVVTPTLAQKNLIVDLYQEPTSGVCTAYDNTISTPITLDDGEAITISSLIDGGQILVTQQDTHYNGIWNFTYVTGTTLAFDGGGCSATDAGAAIRVYKAANSKTVTLRNSLGATFDFYVTVIGPVLASSSVPAISTPLP